jgi:hypothetical protein
MGKHDNVGTSKFVNNSFDYVAVDVIKINGGSLMKKNYYKEFKEKLMLETTRRKEYYRLENIRR